MRAADTLLGVVILGGGLQPAGERLRALLPADCPTELRDGIRKHKLQLLALLQRRFLIVRSELLGETIYFTADEETKNALIEAGAEEGCIYTREELRILVNLNRRASITPDDLVRIHGAKRAFEGRLVPMDE